MVYRRSRESTTDSTWRSVTFEGHFGGSFAPSWPVSCPEPREPLDALALIHCLKVEITRYVTRAEGLPPKRYIDTWYPQGEGVESRGRNCRHHARQIPKSIVCMYRKATVHSSIESKLVAQHFSLVGLRELMYMEKGTAL